jgi:hypothetical protein
VITAAANASLRRRRDGRAGTKSLRLTTTAGAFAKFCPSVASCCAPAKKLLVAVGITDRVLEMCHPIFAQHLLR